MRTQMEDGLTNMDEFLGSDSKAALYSYTLVQEQLFDGDWTHPLLFDTDGDGIDDGWEVEYSLNPNKIDQLEGQDLASEAIVYSLLPTRRSMVSTSHSILKSTTSTPPSLILGTTQRPTYSC